MQIMLPNGARVKVRTGVGRTTKFLNIFMNPSVTDFGQTVGLCGTYDGNKGNDLMKPSGEIANAGGANPNQFSLSWRLVK